VFQIFFLLLAALFFFISRITQNYKSDIKKPILFSFFRKFGFQSETGFFGRHLEVFLTLVYLIFSAIFFFEAASNLL